jgi:hypothetical protein
MKRKYLFPGLLLILCSQWLPAQTIETRGRYTYSMYAWEREESSYPLSIYQFLRFSAVARDWNDLSLNVSLRLLTAGQQEHDPFRAYNLSLSARNLFNNLLDFEIGRQFLHTGIPFGSLDGIHLTLKPLKKFSWQLFGGVESNLFREFKVYEFDEATVYGSTLTYRQFYSTDLQLAYLQKLHNSENQWQIAGLNLNNYSLKKIQLLLQTHFDLLNSRLHRLYASFRYLPSNKISLTVFGKLQSPQIYGDSYFRIFEVEPYTQLAVQANYNLTPVYGLNGGLQYVTVEGGAGQRVMLSVNDAHGSLGFLYETGDFGDQLSGMLNYGYEVLNDLVLSVGIDYSHYRFEEIYDYENQLANTIRLHYSISKNWKTDLEYQWLNNRFSDGDNRLLNHVHFIW